MKNNSDCFNSGALGVIIRQKYFVITIVVASENIEWRAIQQLFVFYIIMVHILCTGILVHIFEHILLFLAHVSLHLSKFNHVVLITMGKT